MMHSLAGQFDSGQLHQVRCSRSTLTAELRKEVQRGKGLHRGYRVRDENQREDAGEVDN